MKKVYQTRLEINKLVLATLAIPEDHRPSWPEVAERNNVPVQKLHDQVTRLRKKGMIAPKVVEPTRTPEASFDAIIAEIEAGKGGTPENRRKVLEEIQAAGSDQNKIRAVQVLNDMDSLTDRGIGPTVPLTDADKEIRLATLMEICGRKVTNRAMERAFGEAKSQKVTAAASQ